MKYKLIGLALIVIGFAACDTASQDVEPVISPDGKPAATFTASSTSQTLKEGDTLIYTIKTDRMIDRSITFSADILSGTADESDYVIEPATLLPYTKEVKMYIIGVEDNSPEAEETVKFDINVPSIADKYLLNTSVTFPTVDLKIANVNDPTLLTIVFSWPTEDDMDIVTWSDTDENPLTEWGDGGATSSNPEIDNAIWLTDPVGTYYVNIMDWDAGIDFNYTFTLGHPDGSVTTITGTFQGTDKSIYTNDPWTAWGDSYDSYRVLKVVNDGTKFTVEAIPPLP